jgi:hypothetical protein
MHHHSCAPAQDRSRKKLADFLQTLRRGHSVGRKSVPGRAISRRRRLAFRKARLAFCIPSCGHLESHLIGVTKWAATNLLGYGKGRPKMDK